MLSQFIIQHIKESVQSLLVEQGAASSEDIRVMVEQPARMEHGDYSTNVAMQLAKQFRKPPIQIAEQIKERLEQRGRADRLIAKIETVSPGFINLFIDWRQWAKTGFMALTTAGQKAVIEHTSINPNKSAHIGHLRNSVIGDVIARLLRRLGYRVEVHNYIDDLGNQLADTVVGLLELPLQEKHTRFGDYCWDLYAKINREYEADSRLVEHRTRILHALEEGNSNISWLGLLTAERIVREHLEEMRQFGIVYDLLVWESSIMREGFWSTAFEQLRQTSLFGLETEGKLAGCWVLKQASGSSVAAESDHSADKVLVRSNGILTYTAKDIAYHLWKFGLLEKDFKYKKFSDELWTTHAGGANADYGKAELVVNVIDHRQEYTQVMVKQALSALGYSQQSEQLRHVSYGVVSLSPGAAAELGIDISDGKASYAMSGRQGIGIKIADLLDVMENVITANRSDPNGLSSREIAAAAIRYYLLRFHLQTEVVFDLQQATEISGNTGVYLLYSYARSGSVLSKAEKESGLTPSVPEDMPPMLQAEYALLRHIAVWPETLVDAGQALAPNAICSYAYELAALFNNFYAACPVLRADDATKRFRVWLTALFKETLGDALRVLGLPTPDRM